MDSFNTIRLAPPTVGTPLSSDSGRRIYSTLTSLLELPLTTRCSGTWSSVRRRLNLRLTALIIRLVAGQVQNRLNATQETRRGLQEQLAELRVAIAAEKADRSESVCRLSFDLLWSMDLVSLVRTNGTLLWRSYLASKRTSRKWKKSFKTMVLAIPLKSKRRNGL